MAAHRDLIRALKAKLAAHADTARAAPMQAYMKSAMPFHGVGAVPLRAVCRELFASLALPDAAAFRQAVNVSYDELAGRLSF